MKKLIAIFLVLVMALSVVLIATACNPVDPIDPDNGDNGDYENGGNDGNGGGFDLAAFFEELGKATSYTMVTIDGNETITLEVEGNKAKATIVETTVDENGTETTVTRVEIVVWNEAEETVDFFEQDKDGAWTKMTIEACEEDDCDGGGCNRKCWEYIMLTSGFRATFAEQILQEFGGGVEFFDLVDGKFVLNVEKAAQERAEFELEYALENGHLTETEVAEMGGREAVIAKLVEEFLEYIPVVTIERLANGHVQITMVFSWMQDCDECDFCDNGEECESPVAKTESMVSTIKSLNSTAVTVPTEYTVVEFNDGNGNGNGGEPGLGNGNGDNGYDD